MTKNLKCPVCGGDITETAKGFSCKNWADDKGGCKFTIWKESCGAVFDEDDAEKLINGERVQKTNISKEGKPYEAEWVYVRGGIKQTFERVVH